MECIIYYGLYLTVTRAVNTISIVYHIKVFDNEVSYGREREYSKQVKEDY